MRSIGNRHTELNAYAGLAIMTFLHFLFMYGMNYLMVDAASSIFMNINALYMTLWMVAPSVVIMLIFMKSMYSNKKLNLSLSIISILIFVLSFIFIRQQTFVGDRQFIRSMIPHHSGAISCVRKVRSKMPSLKLFVQGLSKPSMTRLKK